MPPHIVVFFDNNGKKVRAVEMNGLLIKSPNNYWKLCDGPVSMPFPHVMSSLMNTYIQMEVRCVAQKHIPQSWCVSQTLYADHLSAKIILWRNKTNNHSLDVAGFFTYNSMQGFGLLDSNHDKMPLGIALKTVESRIVDILIENIYPGSGSVLNCLRQQIY